MAYWGTNLSNQGSGDLICPRTIRTVEMLRCTKGKQRWLRFDANPGFKPDTLAYAYIAL